MMSEKLNLSIPNNFDQIPLLVDRMLTFLRPAGLTSSLIYSLNLIVEEVLTNIIKYAYEDRLSHEIQVSAHIEDGDIVVQFIDDGIAFDPLSLPPPPMEDDPLERPIGGLGIYLVRETARSAQYRREGQLNVFTVRLRLPEAASGEGRAG
jgi:anti-sigma regulatory factor (Ser/Thr protein kinase)